MPKSLTLALASLALLATTCSDPDDGRVGVVAGYATYGTGPLVGARVQVHQFFEGGETFLAGEGTTDAQGRFEVEVGDYFQQLTITVAGGVSNEASGATLALDATDELRAIVLEHPPLGRSEAVVSPFTDLGYHLGRARFAAGQDADDIAAMRAALTRVSAHVGADVVAIVPAPVGAASPFDEHGTYAVALAGYEHLAALIARDLGVTRAAVNVRLLHDQIVRDASSAEARLDGNGAEVLSVGPACPLPSGCSVEGLGCYASCSIMTSTLRGRTAAAALAWLATPDNRTGLGASDVLTWATAVTGNTDPQLFGAEPPEVLDEAGPTITWVTPAAGQIFTAGAIALDLTAADPLGVASLGVDHVVGQARTPLVDTDPSPDRFVASIPLSASLAEGPLTLEAHATDRDGNASTSTRVVTVDQLSGGTLSGVAIKAALAAAPVTVRAFAGGAPGALLVSGTTDPAGNFTNLLVPEGTQGPLLVEVGGAGSYAEDALPSTVVSLAATEKLSVVIPAYVDGDTISNLVLSPATTLAVAYLSYLVGANQGGADLSAQWATATSALERHLGISGLASVVPSVPSQVDSLDDADRYGLVLLALSRSAWQASSLGGGDAGAFGPAVNAMKVLQVWVRDLGDGCWDGKAGTTPLSYGGPSLLSDEATRLHLAQALVAYLAGAQNQTQLASAADVLPLLDTLATGGGNTAPGACPGTNHLFDDDGAPFDREGPVITWGAFPPSDPFVRGTVTVTASAVDNLPSAPSLLFTSGQTDIDVASSAVRATIDTTTLADGPIPLAVRATDGSGNVSLASHDLIADNTAPTIAITAPAADGLFLRPPVTLGWSVADANLATSSATLDAATTVTPGFQVAAEGPHALAVSASDRAGGASSASRTFTIDSTAPVLSVTAPAHGSFVRGPVTLSFSVSDANPGATASATLDGNAITSGASINTEGPHTLVVNATDAAGNLAATVTRAFTLDNTPPVITVSGVVDGGAYNTNLSPSFSATDTYTASPTFTATLDGSPHASGAIVSSESNHVLVVMATDQAGNTATSTRTFLLDKQAPVLSLTSQVPSGAYVRGMLAFTVTGDDTLAIMGSLAANIGVVATLAGAPVVPTLSYPVIAGGRRQVVAAFAAGALADGALRLSFTLTDRAGNIATPLVVDRTVDNTAPTGLTITGIDTATGHREYWDAAALPPTRWVNTATPTLLGSVTEANPGATVTVTVGASSVAGTLPTASSWRGAVPAGSISAGGGDATVTIADAAGNTASITQRLRADTVAPTVDSPSSTIVRDEGAEVPSLVTLPTPRWSHNHNGATVSLGGSVMTCPEVKKYAYLTAPTPEATESAANPLAFNWLATDAGVGVDVATVRYYVRTPGGATRGPYTTLTGAGGTPTAYSYATTLYRNSNAALGVPELGIPGVTEEGAFYVDAYADDRLGNASLVATRCWTHRPRAVPVTATSPAALGTETAYGEALSNLSLASNHAISSLLNGSHPGAGFMTYTVQNITADDAWVSFAPSAASVTYSKDWRYYRTNTAETIASINCTYDGGDFVGTGGSPDARCQGGVSGTLTGGNEAVSGGSSPVAASDLTVRVWEERSSPTSFIEITPCTAAPACVGRFQLAANKKYRVVVGAKSIPALRQTSVASGYSELVRMSDPVDYSAFPPTATITETYATVNRTSTAPQPLSQSGPGINQACNRWVNVASPDYRCNRVATYQAVKYLYSASVVFNMSGASGTASAGASLGAVSANADAVNPPSLLSTPQWSTTEN